VNDLSGAIRSYASTHASSACVRDRRGDGRPSLACARDSKQGTLAFRGWTQAGARGAPAGRKGPRATREGSHGGCEGPRRGAPGTYASCAGTCASAEHPYDRPGGTRASPKGTRASCMRHHGARKGAYVPNATLMGPGSGVFATLMGPANRQGHGATRKGHAVNSPRPWGHPIARVMGPVPT